MKHFAMSYGGDKQRAALVADVLSFIKKWSKPEKQKPPEGGF
jgi:hypothetical protein